jgi:putative ABC transport system permease protein
VLMNRHHDTEDFTITTQEAMLEVLNEVMTVVTLAGGGIAGISLIVGAIGILTMMWIAVGERTAEIGLLRAIGANPGQIFGMFLAESIALAVVGAALGVLIGLGLLTILQMILPGLPVHIDLHYLTAGLIVATITGLLSGVLPARRAAMIDPVEALHAE